MQLVINIEQEQDLQLLVNLLERLKIAYTPLSSKVADVKNQVPEGGNLSDKYAGKLSAATGAALQQHIAKSRDEWERI